MRQHTVFTLSTTDQLAEFQYQHGEREQRHSSTLTPMTVQNITAIVVSWNVRTYNVTITAIDFHESRLITLQELIILDQLANIQYLVQLSCFGFRHNTTLPSNFTIVGETVQLQGMVRNSTAGWSMIPINADKVFIPFQITNSNGETITLRSREKMMNVHENCHGRHERFPPRNH